MTPPRSHPSSKVWERIRDDLRRKGVDGWLLVCPYHLGDTFLIGSLMKSFQEAHGAVAPNVYMMTDAKQADIARLFHPWVTSPVVQPDLTPALAHALGPYAAFEPNRPFIVHMLHYGDGRLGAFMGHRGVNVLDVWRYILQLPLDAPAVAPTVWPELQAQAEATFAATGLPRGRTAVLFPKAYTTPPPADAYWVALARRLERAGWTVATSVVGNEKPFEGTVPVRFSIVETIPFVELAGWAIASRSGIADVFAYANCRKTVIYTRRIGLRAFGLASMGMALDSHEYLMEGEPSVDRVAEELAGRWE